MVGGRTEAWLRGRSLPRPGTSEKSPDAGDTLWVAEERDMGAGVDGRWGASSSTRSGTSSKGGLADISPISGRVPLLPQRSNAPLSRQPLEASSEGFGQALDKLRLVEYLTQRHAVLWAHQQRTSNPARPGREQR